MSRSLAPVVLLAMLAAWSCGSKPRVGEPSSPKTANTVTIDQEFELGPGVYGAEAAAWHWYGKGALSLTRVEAAQLAASLPRPSKWNPASQSQSYARHVERILGRIERTEWLRRRI